MTGFWIFMLVVDIIVPLTMVGFGLLFSKSPPRNINYAFGYRTSLSMRSQATWDYAHRICGKIWFRVGLIILPLSVVPLIFVWGTSINTISITGLIVCAVQLVPLMAVFIPVERGLRRNFDVYGRPLTGKEH